MIDVKSLREDREPYYRSMKDRFMDTQPLDEFFDLDEKWRNNLKQLNDLRHEKNEISLQISSEAKKGVDSSEKKAEVKKINAQIDVIGRDQSDIERKRNDVVKLIPNLLDPTVPICKGDENNKVVRYSGNPSVFKEDAESFRSCTPKGSAFTTVDKRPMSHVDLLEKLNLVDLSKAAKVSGARFYYLKNRFVKLEMALMNYAVDFLSQRGFSIVEPPFMLTHESMDSVTDLDTFQDALYKIEGEDLYLIATAEHPIGAYLKDELLDDQDLPMRIAGISPCFRREAGAHGKDSKGIFRVHQFNKVEQFIFCKPEHASAFLEELLKNAEEFTSSLGLAYRVVNICSGELSILNAQKFDIEAWFPSQGKFREIVSASNNTDYQGRSLNIRYRTKDGNRAVNTLNSTAVATSRMLVAIAENFQEPDASGIRVPRALVPYTGFDFISQ